MKNFIYILITLLLTFSACKQEKKKDAIPEYSIKPQVENKNVDQKVISWGNDDVPSPDADLTRDAPIEVQGGLKHDVGAFMQGEQQLHELLIKNASDKPLKLQEINADCACTNVDGIPGGILLEPGEKFAIDIRIDGTRLDVGPFEKHIILQPLEYKPIRVSIVGKVMRFYSTIPPSKSITFDAKGNPRDKWTGSLTIIGVDEAKDKLELEVLKSKKQVPYIEASLEKQDANVWKLTVRPIRPLPYTSNFTEQILIKVVKPERMPLIPILVKGAVGMSLRWSNPTVNLKEDDFKDGFIERYFQLGIDLADAASMQNHRLMSQIEKVDWQRLFDELEIRAPEGVKYEKKFTRFGVRLDVKAQRSAFSDKGVLKIETGCNGNWEGLPITLHIKEVGHSQK